MTLAEVGSTASNYEILAKLATGGMAELYLARAANTAGVTRYVVLKRVLRERAADANFVRMFLDEARLAAQLQHPNIAQVYDIGKLGDSYFFTMEYVHGETVRALLHRSHALRKPIPIACVLTIVAGAAAGLQHAHERIGLDGRPLGIVHRDVSPSNLMVSYEGHVKVVDFGVAKAEHRDVETRSGAVKGKIGYMSPEQCRGAPLDRRSDLFSLGIVMWEMLTSERRFKRGSDFENMAAIVNEESPLVSSRRSEVPPELDAIARRLLDRDPATRYQTSDELLEDLERVAVQTGSVLSVASLGRFIRELFGQRPEPWVEMQSREVHPEVYTVTSEPIPADVLPPAIDTIDRGLRAVPDLSRTPEHSGASDLEPPGARAMPLRAPTLTPLPLTLPMIPVAPVVAPAVPTAPMPMASSGPTPSGVAGVYPLPQSYPVVTAAMVGSGRMLAEPTPAPGRRVPRVVWILGPAIVLGIIVGVAISMRGADSRPETARVTVTTPPPGVEPPPAVTVDAAVVAAVAIDAATVAAATPPPTDAAVAPEPIDAAVTPEPNDAAVEPVAVDAGVTVKPHFVPPPPHLSPGQELLKQLHDGKYDAVVTSCAGSAALVAQNAGTCALGACHVHDADHARAWLAATGSKHAAIASACKGLGVELEPDCKADPMACPH